MIQGFLHLLPEVYEGWQTYAENNHIDVNLSLGIVVVCAGLYYSAIGSYQLFCINF